MGGRRRAEIDSHTRTDEILGSLHEIRELADTLGDDLDAHSAETRSLLADLGLFGLLIPKRFGGSGLSISQYVPILRDVAKAHGGLRTMVHVHNSFAYSLNKLASGGWVDNILRGAAVGEKSIAFALTEPSFGTGTDVGTTASQRDDGSFALAGDKWLITNADFATHFIVFARVPQLSPERRDQLSVFVVDVADGGVEVSPLPETMGCRGGFHGRVSFRGATAQPECVVGELGRGSTVLEESLSISRVLVAVSSLGVAEECLELALEYGRQRVTHGRPIVSRQAVQRYVAEMAMDVHALRLLTEHAALQADAGTLSSHEASIVKLFGLEAVGRVTDKALLVHGGIGYTGASRLERLYRDARLNWLEEGTPSVQHTIISRGILDACRARDDAKM